MPRPELELIGLNYRRIPVIAVDGDVYCDTDAIAQFAQSHGTVPKLPRGASLLAHKVLGDAIFRAALPCVPPQALTEAWIKDRAPLFPQVADKDFLAGKLRNPGLAELRSMLLQFQDSIDGDWLGGSSHVTMLDVNVVWVIRWVLTQIGVGKEPGFTKNEMPGLWSWFERFMDTVKINPEQITAEEASKIVLSGNKVSLSAERDQYEKIDIEVADKVSVTQKGVEPTHPVDGQLVSLGVHEFVVQTDSKIHVHFPRIGQQIRSA